LIVNENGQMPRAERAFHHYETILYAFYNKEITIDDIDMTVALSDCYHLLEISDYLGCTSLISKPVEVALFKHGQNLFQAIRGSPHAWIEMAYRVRSELIFKECIIHLVGDWRNLGARTDVTEAIRDVPGVRGLIEKYRRALVDQARDLETKVLTHYPQAMRLPSEELPIKREAYARDILVWMALTFFRQWVSQRLLVGRGRDAPDGGYELYTLLGAGGDRYMDKTVVNQFHTHFPMTKKAMNVLENHLFEIKNCIRQVVTDSAILRSHCQLDVHRFPIKHMTCTVFDREDFPWLKEEREASSLPVKRTYKPGGNEISRLNLETARRFQRVGSEEVREDIESDAEMAGDEDEVRDPHYRSDSNKRLRHD
jgi:hypothetical protein